MMTFDEFEQAVKEELELLPDYVQEGLIGGVLVDEAAYLHPGSMADDLYIFGTYSAGGYTGNQIVLYYGSFRAVMGNMSNETVRRQIRETVRHEFLHHLETRAGLFGKGSLAEKDRDRLIEYYRRHGR